MNTVPSFPELPLLSLGIQKASFEICGTPAAVVPKPTAWIASRFPFPLPKRGMLSGHQNLTCAFSNWIAKDIQPGAIFFHLLYFFFLMMHEEKQTPWIMTALWRDKVFVLLYFNILPDNDIFSSLEVGQGVNLITHSWNPEELKPALGFSGNRGLSEIPEKWDSIF